MQTKFCRLSYVQHDFWKPIESVDSVAGAFDMQLEHRASYSCEPEMKKTMSIHDKAINAMNDLSWHATAFRAIVLANKLNFIEAYYEK